jgi:peroxiredoxin Q/BCP
MNASGKVILAQAPAFSLMDMDGRILSLPDLIREMPAVLVFYPKDFAPTCTRQLCNYRDNLEEFRKIPVQIVGIGSDSVESHRAFQLENRYPFRLLCDPGGKTARAYGCTSLFMLGGLSRAVFIVNQAGVILYRYVEPTVLTSRKADQVIGVLQDLKRTGLI